MRCNRLDTVGIRRVKMVILSMVGCMLGVMMMVVTMLKCCQLNLVKYVVGNMRVT